MKSIQMLYEFILRRLEAVLKENDGKYINKLLTIYNVFTLFSLTPVHKNENYAMIYSHSSHPRCL